MVDILRRLQVDSNEEANRKWAPHVQLIKANKPINQWAFNGN